MITLDNANRFVRGLFTDVWVKRNIDTVSKYYHPDFLGLLHGKEEFRYTDVLKRVCYSKENYTVDSECVFHDIFTASDKRIVARFSMQSINTRTAKQEIYHFLSVIDLKDSKMYRQWSFSNQSYFYKAWELPEHMLGCATQVV